MRRTGSSLISMRPTIRCTASRRGGSSTAITTATATCRSTSSAGAIWWPPSCGARTLTLRPTRWRIWRHRRSNLPPLSACADSAARQLRLRARAARWPGSRPTACTFDAGWRKPIGSSLKSRPSLRGLRRRADVPASRRGGSRTSAGRRGAAGAAGAGLWRRRNGQKTRPILASSSPRSRMPSARPAIFTKRSTVFAATWRTGTRNAGLIFMPIAPRPPPCGQTSCACGLPRWPMCCCASLRRIALHHTPFAKATCSTIRLKLLKIAPSCARVPAH